MDEEERIFALMMDALDDEIDETGTAELTAYLADHPALAQEWTAMQWVDNLLVTTPPVEAPHSLVAHTVARLPNLRFRRVFVWAGFGLSLLAGLLTVLVALVLANVDLGAAAGASAAEFWMFGRVFTTAINATLLAVLRQTQVWVYLAGMVGTLVLWRLAYQQMLNNRPQLLSVHARRGYRGV